jgi:hypothetical protein
MKRRSVLARRSRRWIVGLALTAFGSTIALVGEPAVAAPQRVNGHFDLRTSSGPDCASPFGVCMTGSVSGRIKGTFSFTAMGLIPTSQADVIVTTGDAVVDTGEGTILCALTGTLQLNDEGPFVGLCVVTGGTGAWATAGGYLRTTGTFTLGGGGTGTYDGKVVA